MDKEKLVDLAAFRGRNGLKQEDLAQLLGVNRSYISQVETGSCRISADKMKKLREVAKTKPWFMDDLVPAYDRIEYVYFTVRESLSFEPLDPHEEDKDYYSPEKQALLQQFERDFARVITESVRESIWLGQQGIDSTLADKIIAILPPGFRYNKEWLMTGEGPIRPGDTLPERTPSSEWDETIDPGRIYPVLEKVLQKQEELERMVKEIKELLLNKA